VLLALPGAPPILLFSEHFILLLPARFHFGRRYPSKSISRVICARFFFAGPLLISADVNHSHVQSTTPDRCIQIPPPQPPGHPIYPFSSRLTLPLIVDRPQEAFLPLPQFLFWFFNPPGCLYHYFLFLPPGPHFPAPTPPLFCRRRQVGLSFLEPSYTPTVSHTAHANVFPPPLEPLFKGVALSIPFSFRAVPSDISERPLVYPPSAPLFSLPLPSTQNNSLPVGSSHGESPCPD